MFILFYDQLLFELLEKKGIDIVTKALRRGIHLSVFIFAFLGLILIEELVVVGLKRYINGAFRIECYFLRLYKTYRIRADLKKVC